MQIVNTKTLAGILGVNPETIRRKVREGKLTAIPISKTEFRYNLETALEEFKKNA